MKNLIKAVRWEVAEGGGKRFIQLYDAEDNKVAGKDAYWDGNFNCSCNKLTSLEGAPRAVGGDFYCSYNKLTSLEGAPAKKISDVLKVFI